MQSTAGTKPKKNIEKDSHAFRLSHEAFLFLQALAEKEGLQSGAFLEHTIRELAKKRLSPEQRVSIIAQAKHIAAVRSQAAQRAAS